MGTWEEYVDQLVAAGWTAEQIGWDLEGRGWPEADAHAFAHGRMAVHLPASPPSPPAPAAAWGEPGYVDPLWAQPAMPLASMPPLAAFPSTDDLRRQSERTELAIRILAALAVVGVAAGTITFHQDLWGEDLLGSRFALLGIPFGILTIFAAVSDAEWFFDRGWVRFLCRLFSRNGVRGLYVVSGSSGLLAALTYGLAPTYGF